MNIPSHCDVVVIGGGPAGSLAATFLSQKGIDVVLLERKAHPRPHVGESILPHFWKYCDLAGVSNKIAAEGFIRKAGGTVIWKDVIRQMGFKEFGYTRPSLHVERERFDQILFEHAREEGVQSFEEVSVLSCHFDELAGKQSVIYRLGHSPSTAQITCRFVVDASGQHALVAKQLGVRVVDESFRFMSIWGYFENSKYIALDGKAYPFEALTTVPPTTFISSIPNSGDWGWMWHIPLRHRTSVGLVLPIEFSKAAKASGESWEAYYLRKCAEIPYLNQLLQDADFCEGSLAKVHDYSYRSTQVAGSGFFLIGDAAGFIDPIFSAGVILGMYSAYLAAWAIERSLKKPAEAAHYQDIFSNQLQGRLEVTRSLSLPGYQLHHQISDLAKNTVNFESALEQQLMNAASQMTTRGDNFARLTGQQEESATGSKLRILQQLVF